MEEKEDMNVKVVTCKDSSKIVSVTGSVATTNEVEVLHSAFSATSQLGGNGSSFLYFVFNDYTDSTSSVQLLIIKK